MNMAENASKIIEWLQSLDPDAQVGVDDGGLTLEVVGNPKVYYEIGGIPRSGHNRTIRFLLPTRHMQESDDRRLRELMPDPGDGVRDEDRVFDVIHTGDGFLFQRTWAYPTHDLVEDGVRELGLSWMVRLSLIEAFIAQHADEVLFTDQAEYVDGLPVREEIELEDEDAAQE
jgi:hypothetical protein